MKRMLYLCLLLVIPLILQADHGRKRLNGKWINPYFNKTIKVKVKRHEIKVKGLSRRGWTYFTPIRRNVFEDCNGNRIKIQNIHQLVYINRFRGERIRFIKKGHRHHNHTCNSRCAIGDDFFTQRIKETAILIKAVEKKGFIRLIKENPIVDTLIDRRIFED